MSDLPPAVLPPNLMRPEDMQRTKQFEGFVPSIYLDTKNKRTIGYGFNIDDAGVASQLPQDVVSGRRKLKRSEADAIFGKLYVNARVNVSKLVGDKVFNGLPDDVKYVLTDMSYNMGTTKLGGFKNMLKAVAKNNWSGAANEMVDSNWYSQVGNRSKSLVDTMNSVGKQVGGM